MSKVHGARSTRTRVVRKSQKKFAYKNTLMLLASFGLLYAIADTAIVAFAIDRIISYGYLGAFAAGMFSVSAFTVVPATYVLVQFTDLTLPLVALCAATGSVAGDMLLFRFFRDGVYGELRPIVQKIGGRKLIKTLRHPKLSWLAIGMGALIIASPLPDEIGVGLMGLSRISSWRFAAFSFALNVVGIITILYTVRAVVTP